MIALQSLKYIIWDYCLLSLFEGFKKNFQMGIENLIDVKDLYIGKKIYKIKRGEITFYNCEILDIRNTPNKEGYVITFICSYREVKNIRKEGKRTIFVIWGDNSILPIYNRIYLIDFS